MKEEKIGILDSPTTGLLKIERVHQCNEVEEEGNPAMQIILKRKREKGREFELEAANCFNS